MQDPVVPMQVRVDSNPIDFIPVVRLTVPVYYTPPTFGLIPGDLFAFQQGDAFDLFYSDGVYDQQITYGPYGTTQNLSSVLFTGPTSDGYDIIMTGASNIILPTLLTTDVSGFLQLTSMPGVPSGDTGSQGELAYNSVVPDIYVHNGGGVWESLLSLSSEVWEVAGTVPNGVIRANLVTVPDAAFRVFMFGGADPQAAGTRHMFDPVSAFFWGGTTTASATVFPTNYTSNTFAYGYDNYLARTGAFTITNGAMLGGEINNLNANTNNATNNIVIAGLDNTIDSCSNCAIFGGSSNDFTACCNNCFTAASIGAEIGYTPAVPPGTNAILQCGSIAGYAGFFTFDNFAGSCTFENCGIYCCGQNSAFMEAIASSTTVSQSAIIASDLIGVSFYTVASSMEQTAIISCDDCIIEPTQTSQAAFIACDQLNITSPVFENSVMIATTSHNISSNVNRSAMFCANSVFFAMDDDTVYATKLYVYGELSFAALLTSANSIGTVTLVAGTATIATNYITTNDHIVLTCITALGTPGFLYLSARTNGAPGSFTISSTSALDTSIVRYIIISDA